MRTFAFVVVVLLGSVAVASAQGPINPSTLTWTAPTTNADGTPLTDMGEYRVRCASGATAPTYNPTVYTVRVSVASSVAAPAANTTVTVGTAGQGSLATTLGLTTDGQYHCYVTAVDLAGNESGVQAAAIPFVRNRLAPAVPSGVTANP